MNNKTRVRLLNDGGYGDMDKVKFPVEVEATISKSGLMTYVCYDELKRVGADDLFYCKESDGWPFEIGEDCEVIE